MATTAQSIIQRVQYILQESGAGVRWTTAELLEWINAGVQEICAIRKSAYTLIAVYQLTQGTKQGLPTDAVDLIDVIRNMGVNGTTPGAVVRKVPKQIMDAVTPNWHTETAATAIKHYMYDPVTPKTWYCYPPSDGTGRVELKYAAVPSKVNNANDPIPLDDIYAGPLTDYVVYRAFSKDAEMPANATMAAAARAMFENSMGLKASADAAAVKLPQE